MKEQFLFLQSLIDSLSEQIAVIDQTGEIVFVNRTWRSFGAENGFPSKFTWLGENYLEVCRKAAAHGDRTAAEITGNLEQVINGKDPVCEIDYPCHSPMKKRWYSMRATAIRGSSQKLFVIAHREVTRRKLAEEKAAKMALEDSLSGLANRRRFDQVLKEEWRRCKRNKSAISLIMIDLDHFKSYNDTFGHPAGDVCLQLVAKALTPLARRAGDLVARVGGEEFVILLPGMDADDAAIKAEKARLALESIPLSKGLKQSITASFGVVSVSEDDYTGSIIDFIRSADEALYKSKSNGRNRVTAANAS